MDGIGFTMLRFVAGIAIELILSACASKRLAVCDAIIGYYRWFEELCAPLPGETASRSRKEINRLARDRWYRTVMPKIAELEEMEECARELRIELPPWPDHWPAVDPRDGELPWELSDEDLARLYKWVRPACHLRLVK
jgi:hypothetical protein